MRLLISILTLALSVATIPVWAADKPAATVNGKPISNEAVEKVLQQRSAQAKRAPTAEDREAVVNELVNRELLYQEAVRQGVDKSPDVVFQVQQQTVNLVVRKMVTDLLEKEPVTDADLKKEYDENIAKAGLKEYKAKHILVKTEAEAQGIVKQLDNGADFSGLAKEKSTGPSGKDGGELGWFRPNQMVPEFSAAAEKLKKGTYTKKPVKTQYGWHVILLEDVRDSTPPKFEDIKPQLRTVVQTKRIQAMVDDLRNKAKIVTN
jgi:peptidyl-prolyl cis-trans isomerase C